MLSQNEKKEKLIEAILRKTSYCCRSQLETMTEGELSDYFYKLRSEPSVTRDSYDR